MARLKPWTPWVTADHYKKEKKKHYQNNLQPKTAKPQVKRQEEEKIHFLSHQNILCQTP
jgi:hypothetical protein